MSFVSELGKGTTFTLEFHNVKSAEAVPGTGKPTPEQMQQDNASAIGTMREEMKKEGNYHILIADDVALNRSVLKALLKKIGVNDVETAVDGQDALEKIQTSERPFDCVLTDIWMPQMNGRELVAKIRTDERFAKLPVYAVTADVEEQKTFVDRGFTGVLLKPLTIDKLSRLFS